MQATQSGHKNVPTDDRIDGPIPEFDKYGRYTGYDYFRCTHCGAEAMRTAYLQECCEE